MSRHPSEWAKELENLRSAFRPLRSRIAWPHLHRASKVLYESLRGRMPPSEAFALALSATQVEPREFLTIRQLLERLRANGCFVPERTIYRAAQRTGGETAIFMGKRRWDSSFFDGCIAKVRVRREKERWLRFELDVLL